MAYNPFVGWRITGTWEDHMSYSLGGTDYPLPYGTALPAPAAGVLRTSGGRGEFAAGWVGSAGRRSILTLDTPIRDVVAVVFQHQSVFGVPGHYEERETCGWSGASASGRDWGGDIHLHIHCLTADGRRRRFESYFGTAASAGAAVKPISSKVEQKEQRMRVIKIQDGGGFKYALVGEFTFQESQLNDTVQANKWAETWGDARLVSAAAWSEALNMVLVARKAFRS